MSLLFMLGNQVRRMDEKPPVTIALAVGKPNFPQDRPVSDLPPGLRQKLEHMAFT